MAVIVRPSNPATRVFNRVTSGTGPVITLPKVQNYFTLQVNTVGTVTGGRVVIEGSLDGTNWYDFAIVDSGVILSATKTTWIDKNSVGVPTVFIRGRVSVGVTGGGSIEAFVVGL